MGCPFCNQKTLEKRILKKGRFYIVIFSDPRLMPGHLLVIPKRHVIRAVELTAQERKEIFDAIIDLEENIIHTISEGCDISTHYRPFVPEGWTKVHHLHFHLQPRNPNDRLYKTVQSHQSKLWKQLSLEEEAKIKICLSKSSVKKKKGEIIYV